MLINSSSFMKNLAVKENFSIGGAVAQTKISLSPTPEMFLYIFNSQFCGCQAYDKGGAVISSIYTIVQDCRFQNNSAEIGGALACSSGKINNSHFETNNAQKTGGAIYIFPNSELNTSHSTFTGNQAIGGGAIHGEANTSISFEFCSFENNTAGFRHGAGFQ